VTALVLPARTEPMGPGALLVLAHHHGLLRDMR
jgi:hypothetical protein